VLVWCPYLYPTPPTHRIPQLLQNIYINENEMHEISCNVDIIIDGHSMREEEDVS